jgi:hypothetical protein
VIENPREFRNIQDEAVPGDMPSKPNSYALLGWIAVGTLVALLISAILYLLGWDSPERPIGLMFLAVLIALAFAAYGTRDGHGSYLRLSTSALIGAILG